MIKTSAHGAGVTIGALLGVSLPFLIAFNTKITVDARLFFPILGASLIFGRILLAPMLQLSYNLVFGRKAS